MKLFKMIFTAVLIFLALSSSPLNAQYSDSLELSTTVEVSQMEDDTRVMLEGFIGQQAGDDNYIFKDDTGKITIQVEEDTWRGQNVNEDIKVRIVGDYEREVNSEKIEVEWLEIVDL